MGSEPPPLPPRHVAHAHRVQRKERRKHRGQLLAWVLGGTGAVLLVGFIGYAAWAIPPIECVTGDQLSQRFVDPLIEAGVVEPGERIDFAYFEGLSILEGGNVLTERRLISYQWLDESDDAVERFVAWMPREAVLGVELLNEPSLLVDGEYEIEGSDGSLFTILLPDGDENAEAFLGVLRQLAARHAQDAVSDAASGDRESSGDQESSADQESSGDGEAGAGLGADTGDGRDR